MVDDVRVREARAQDAAALLTLKRQLDQESAFMLLEPSERVEHPDEVAAAIQRLVNSGNSVVGVAERPSRLVGYIEATGGRYRRARTTAHLVLGVLVSSSGRGVATGLLAWGESWAREHGLHRLELTVMAHNHRAIRLYQRAGFAVEGRRRECLVVDGVLVDELFMAKLLTAPALGQIQRP
ncbi:MAG: GNAT family N-acetyltransferase [Candidatus Dormibacteria bacterium]